MKELIKVMLLLALLFAATFLLLKFTGVLTLDEIRELVGAAQRTAPIYLALIVILLLFADLFVAIPTMTIAMMAGYFLGWPLGAAAVISGFFVAGTTGYAISRRYGTGLLHRIYQDKDKLDEIHDAFSKLGPWVLISCRAMPILPEVSCCMAGATRMPFYKFLTMYALGTIPYALITTYAGSVSSADEPMPAIITASTLSLLLWSFWYLIGRQRGKR